MIGDIMRCVCDKSKNQICFFHYYVLSEAHEDEIRAISVAFAKDLTSKAISLAKRIPLDYSLVDRILRELDPQSDTYRGRHRDVNDRFSSLVNRLNLTDAERAKWSKISDMFTD